MRPMHKKKPKSYADGGDVVEDSHPSSLATETHRALAKDNMREAKEGHAEKLMNEYDRPSPNLKGLAEGGEVGEAGEDMDYDNEVHDALGDEFMKAMESKDKKQIMSSLEALVLSCMSKKPMSEEE